MKATFGHWGEICKDRGAMTVSTPSKVFADRIGRIEVSATMAVAAEAAKLRAQGVNLVDFGAGEPHFPTPRHIKDAAIAALLSPQKLDRTFDYTRQLGNVDAIFKRVLGK